ncbi:hypothetical protein BCR43DRAFT_518334 [Syncephalastrum racemosum]|uniref:Peptidase S54 rhomboid domain-containing protein n=1 Tax=Syncephalastrum racemosum TaxID=13706 RepID=A0A1X2H3J3_SYNRA|nr:hypothetical protein BCR43DRAFT_518334 [Syncephalastrum racemosum]
MAAFKNASPQSTYFFTQRALTTTTRQQLQQKQPWKGLRWLQQRAYIRPHYYQEKDSLSQALKRQQNPFRQIGQRINNVDPNRVLWTVIGTNITVYLSWQYAIKNYTQFHDAGWLQFMADNFMVSVETIKSGRIWNLLTAAVSHKDTLHLGINMLVLHSIGQGVIEAVGASRFLLLYGAAGITASVATLCYQAFIRPAIAGNIREPRSASLGASGALMGITTFYAFAFPSARFLVFFVVPLPALAVVGGFAAYDLYKAATLRTGIVDSAAHIGGAAYGAAYWFLRVKPLLKAGRWRF